MIHVTTYARIHLLCDSPSVTVTEDTYPSLIIEDGPISPKTELTCSLSGNAEQRAAFAAALRRAADQIERWPE